MRATCPTNLVLLDFVTIRMSGEDYICYLGMFVSYPHMTSEVHTRTA